MSKIKNISGVLMFFCAVTTARGAEYIDRIVAVVNDNIITLSELDVYFNPYAEQIKARGYPPEEARKMLFTVREKVLNQLIDEMLTDQEIKRANISVNEAEINNAIERIKAARFYTDEELQEALKKQGFSMEQYRQQIKNQVLRTKLVNLEVKSKIVLTRQDIEAYYNKHPELYGGEKKYHLRSILMVPPPLATDAEKHSIYARMETVLQKFKTGEHFDSLARRYSESPLAAEGGDLGAFKLDALSSQIQDAVKNLAPGDVTPILSTDQGYQIFYLENIIESPGKPLEEVAEEIREKLYNEIVDKKFHSWLGTLRERSHIKIIQ